LETTIAQFVGITTSLASPKAPSRKTEPSHKYVDSGGLDNDPSDENNLTDPAKAVSSLPKSKLPKVTSPPPTTAVDGVTVPTKLTAEPEYTGI